MIKNILAYLNIDPKHSIHSGLSAPILVEEIIRRNEGVLSQTGAIIVETGEHTGRSPNDKYIVQNHTVDDDQIAWGTTNKALDPSSYSRILSKVNHYLGERDLFVQDAIAGKDPAYARSFRLVSECAWATLFFRNLLLPIDIPSTTSPDFTILHAPYLHADPQTDGTRTGTFIIINFQDRKVLIGGTSYAGEIKKSVFTVMNRILPMSDVFPMHCSANIGISGDTSLFFGLSGTGKTTLSSSADRFLIGDDEHGWSEQGIFNFENGCYAKTINLSQEFEPLIWNASQRFGAVLENVGFDPESRKIDFNDGSKTENTRAAYPLEYINHFVPEGRGGHPKNVFFLTADAFGVLPPISLLTQDQAVYYFLLGYTAKLAGTEKGLGAEPEATFSACFGEPFLPLSPVVYAEMLLHRLKKYTPHVWLINTGWSGGSFGVGSRIKLPYSRAMVNAALENQIDESNCHVEPIFGLRIPKSIYNVPSEMLEPINTWNTPDDYLRVARNLILKMRQRMERYASQLPVSIIKAGPGIQ
mgnify:CR=1 FL=1